MENCLVTKLKSSIQNDNLEVLNKLKMHFSAGDTQTIVLQVSDTTKITCDGGTFSIGPLSLIDVTEATIPSNRAYGVQISTNACSITIHNKYNLIAIKDSSRVDNSNDINTLKYNNLIRIDISKYLKGNVSNLVFPNLNYFRFLNNGLYGNLDSLINNMQTFDNTQTRIDLRGSSITVTTDALENNYQKFNTGSLQNLNAHKITGDFSKLAKLPITTLSLEVTSFDGGTVEEFVQKAIDTTNGGRGAGSIQLLNKELYNNVTYQGEPLTEWPHYKLNWDSEGNITWG